MLSPAQQDAAASDKHATDVTSTVPARSETEAAFTLINGILGAGILVTGLCAWAALLCMRLVKLTAKQRRPT